MPVLFLAHGSPMLALEPGEYGPVLERLGASLPVVRGIVVISAHWPADRAIGVTSSSHPEQIYDFAGFPLELYRVRYRPKGDPFRAQRIVRSLEAAGFKAKADPARGLDHGVWVPLRYLFPQATVPVVQVALPNPETPARLMELGAALAPLRREGVLIIGSGGIVHNLGVLQWRDEHADPQPWAVEFEQWILTHLLEGDRKALLKYREDAPFAALAVPESEHLDPLFVVLGATGPAESIRPVYQRMQYGNLSLLSLGFGLPEEDAAGASS
jgi:4,5-DOPA dioxygenase extradiol